MIFLTIGTTKFSFDRLIKILDESLMGLGYKEKLIIQGGNSTYKSKYHNSQFFKEISFGKMVKLLKEARIVITHGGPATVFLALKYSRNKPLIIPRMAKYREHVNDHQLIFAKHLLRKKIVPAIINQNNLTKEIIAYLQKPEKNSNKTVLKNPIELINNLKNYTNGLELLPKGAFLAITSACNARCLTCDFWKKEKKELQAIVLKKLPESLKEIDITGGEPFLHSNLTEILKMVKNRCPRSRVLITTNGLLLPKIKKIVPKLLKIDKNLAFRVSLDGIGDVHDQIRGVKNAFKIAKETLAFLKKEKVKDLGIIFTLIDKNKNELDKVLSFCSNNRLHFSLNLAFDSPIYFGTGKVNLRPKNKKTIDNLKKVRNYFFKKPSFKNLAKAWFYHQLINYLRKGKRPFDCRAGKDSFYLSPDGKIYLCHFKDYLLGDLKKDGFIDIWASKKRQEFLRQSEICHDCLMICNFKNEIKGNFLRKIF